MAHTAAGKPLGGIARAFTAMQSRLYPANDQKIKGVDPKNWPTANQPVQPIGPPGSLPLNWGFYQGVNQNISPRPDAIYSAAELRDFATYPLARLLIESIKDQVSSITWAIQLRDTPGESLQERRERQKKDPNIPKLTDHLASPDGETPWNEWVRPLLEDLITIDAPAFILRSNLKGKVIQWRTVDGSEILRLIDDQGFTPTAPSPAYTQLWEGIPRLFLTTDQMIYRPRNIVRGMTVASQLYGQSPVQGQAEEIKIGRERLKYVLSFYTEGAVPGIVQMVPPGVQVDKILEGMQWMNTELAGNLAARRQWRMVQSFGGTTEEGPKDEIVQLKEPVLADVFDDLHIRKLAFAFGASAQRLLKQMNRASAEASQEAAQEEGTQPYVAWLKGTIDVAFQRMGFGQYEVIPKAATELDIEKQTEIEDKNLRNGSATIDEVRINRGQEPYGIPETSKPNIYLVTGIVPVEGSIERTQQQHQADITPKPTPVIAPPGGGPKPKPAAGGGTSKKKVATPPIIDPQRKSPKLAIAHARMYTHVANFLHESGKKAAKVISERPVIQQVVKVEDDSKEIESIVDSVLNEIDWAALVEMVEPDLSAAAVEGGEVGITDLEITVQDVISEVNEVAREYASERAAEMVGMKRVDGKLVSNPNASMRIDESTRNMVREAITEAFSADTPVSDLAERIQSSRAFSEKRAQLIAENEVRQAQVRGNLAAWTAEGLVEKFRWQLSGDHSCCDICDRFAEEGPYPLAEAEAMLLETHILCACILIATKIKGINF